MSKVERLDKVRSAILLLGGTPVAPQGFPRTVSGLGSYLHLSGVRYFSAREVTRMRQSGGPLLPRHEVWHWAALLGLIGDRCRQAVDSSVTCKWWYRPPRVNRAVKGAKASDHLTGSAFDLYYEDRDKMRHAYQVILRPLYETRAFSLSLGIGHRMTHVGVFSPKGQRRWIY